MASNVLVVFAALCAVCVCGRPLSLLRPDETGASMLVSDEGLEFLRSLGDVPLAIVAVAGPARTGKTFFINQLAGLDATTSSGETGGFAVGHGVTGVTKGIWVHTHVVDAKTPAGKPMKVVFMDTEGFGAPGNLEAFDPKLCFLTTVFASAFFYNVLDNISMVGRRLSVGVPPCYPSSCVCLSLLYKSVTGL